jgi:hypothetical protein
MATPWGLQYLRVDRGGRGKCQLGGCLFTHVPYQETLDNFIAVEMS